MPPISGNTSSQTFSAKRAGLPANSINIQNAELDGDDKVWPCGLILHKGASGWAPYEAGDTGKVAVLDQETDTAAESSALVVRFGAVRVSELKVGVDAPAAPNAAALDLLDDRHIYPV